MDIVERLELFASVGDQGRKPDKTHIARQAAAEITRLRAELAGRDERLAYAKWAADGVLGPICAEIGKVLYQWKDCPNLIAEAHQGGVVVSAAAFANLYDATNWDDVTSKAGDTAILETRDD